MAQITIKELQAIAPVSTKAAELFLPYIYKYQGDVNSPIRFAAFLANVLHESGCFKYVREIASGDAYEGRKDLGNVFKGDGRTFKGRSLMQITGRANYLECSKDMFGDDRLIKNPELLATPEIAVQASYWYWNKRKLNAIADTGDFVKVCVRINGGKNGLEERKRYYDALFKALNKNG